MHPADIKAELEKMGFSLTDVARRCEVTLGAVRNTIYNRPFPSPKVRDEISRIIQRDVEEIWPELTMVAA